MCHLNDFKPLPGNPANLTIKDVRSAFAGDWSALKEVIKIAQEVVTNEQHFINKEQEL